MVSLQGEMGTNPELAGSNDHPAPHPTNPNGYQLSLPLHPCLLQSHSPSNCHGWSHEREQPNRSLLCLAPTQQLFSIWLGGGGFQKCIFGRCIFPLIQLSWPVSILCIISGYTLLSTAGTDKAGVKCPKVHVLETLMMPCYKINTLCLIIKDQHIWKYSCTMRISLNIL